MRRRFLLTALILTLSLLALRPAAPVAAIPEPIPLGVSVYWAEYGGNKLRSATVDGTNQRTLAATATQPNGLAIDIGLGQLYWTDTGTSSIKRVDTIGTGTPVTIVPSVSAGGIAIDTAAQKIYYTQGGLIKRANADGTGITTFASGQSCPVGIAVDRTSAFAFWTDPCTGTIKRSSGFNIDTLASGLAGPGGIALDIYAGKMYWVDTTAGTISRANLNGTSVQTIIPSGINTPEAIAVDPFGGWIYWTEFISPGVGKVRAARLDGTLVQDVAPAGGTPVGIAIDNLTPPTGFYDVAVDPVGGDVYYNDFGTTTLADVRQNRIVRTSLDGTSPAVVVQRPIPNPNTPCTPNPSPFQPPPDPFSIALDLTGGKLYWSGQSAAGTCAELSRANPSDGSSPEALQPAPGPHLPQALALDAPNTKLYFTDPALDRIAEFDTNDLVDTTVVGVVNPRPMDIALDLTAGRMYWTEGDAAEERVMRATLAGASVTELVGKPMPTPAKPNPHPHNVALALDVAGNRMYVSDNSIAGRQRIVRYNLDGTNPTELVGLPTPTPGEIRAIALDLVNGRIYYTDYSGLWRVPIAGGTPTLLVKAFSDLDFDGISETLDNCPTVSNVSQADGDADDLGNACEATPYGTNAADADSDNDGCRDGREVRVWTYTPDFGGDRDPLNSWDFFDVTADQKIDLSDAIDVLGYFGDAGTSPAGNLRDRAVLNPAKPWRTSEANDGIDLTDAIFALLSFGHECGG